jgi:flagellar basal body-associated protein FliL
MKHDDIIELFNQLDFDIVEPAEGHEQRFRQKLKNKPEKKAKRWGINQFWGPVMAVAASFIMTFLIFQGDFNNPFSHEQELANVSPEMKQTQDFYTSVIKSELENLKARKSPENEAVIEDVLKQLKVLERDYENLKKDLGKSGQDKRVIYAMISNFQKRIDLLNMVLEKVETINSLKNNRHENNII